MIWSRGLVYTCPLKSGPCPTLSTQSCDLNSVSLSKWAREIAHQCSQRESSDDFVPYTQTVSPTDRMTRSSPNPQAVLPRSAVTDFTPAKGKDVTAGILRRGHYHLYELVKQLNAFFFILNEILIKYNFKNFIFNKLLQIKSKLVSIVLDISAVARK